MTDARQPDQRAAIRDDDFLGGHSVQSGFRRRRGSPLESSSVPTPLQNADGLGRLARPPSLMRAVPPQKALPRVETSILLLLGFVACHLPPAGRLDISPLVQPCPYSSPRFH